MRTFMTVFCFNLCTQWFVYSVFGLCVCSLVPTICGITCSYASSTVCFTFRKNLKPVIKYMEKER